MSSAAVSVLLLQLCSVLLHASSCLKTSCFAVQLCSVQLLSAVIPEYQPEYQQQTSSSQPANREE